MTLTKQKISIENSTFNQLLIELQEECQNVLSLVNQLQLSELLVASIHLHSHCDEDWQNLISDELENIADD